MINTFKNLFGLGPKTDYRELMDNGAIILDVRSKAEFDSGHIKGSRNIPVDRLGQDLDKLKNKEKPVITCWCFGNQKSFCIKFSESNWLFNRRLMTVPGPAFRKKYNHNKFLVRDHETYPGIILYSPQLFCPRNQKNF
jgi:phage shock protein E